MKLGTIIRNARKKKGLTQKIVAQKMGTTVGYISQLETNQRGVTYDQLEKLGSAIGTKVNITFE